MKIYNSRTRKIEVFESLVPGQVKMYSCGPTVYDRVHIGNLRAFLFADYLKKTLQFLNYQVIQVMNITDFGHLKGDADDTEDKMSEGLRRENLPKTLEGMKILADKYTEIFFQDIQKINIQPANYYPRAIEYIDDYIQIIRGLEAKSFTYKISDGIYFDTKKDLNYGFMSLLDHSHQIESRIGEKSEKKHPADFCLWKFKDPKLSVLGFPSPWGEGFPGWHIECSGMALKFLGEQMDIHTGGVDHINIHHTNEIAQSENYTGKIYATFFCHNEFLDINGQKMSKSLNNFISLNDILEKGFDPLAFRYLTLQNHYRKKMNFTWEALEASQKALHKLQKQVSNFVHTNIRELANNYLKEFQSCLENDLNLSEALGVTWKLIKDHTISENQKYWSILEMDKIFSLSLDIGDFEERAPLSQYSPEIQKLIDERHRLRGEKNWAEADRIREKLNKLGVHLADK